MLTRKMKDMLTNTLYDCASQHGITVNELYILRMIIIEGHSLTALARNLHRSIKTISTHKRSAYGKLGLTSDIEVIHYLYHINHTQERNVAG